jgi:hypothetical protein
MKIVSFTLLITFLLKSNSSLGELPGTISELGMYDDMQAKTIHSSYQEFYPQYALWSDGADKTRWVHLPKGSSIDVSNMDSWVFPLGSVFAKEFRHLGRRIETRIYRKVSEGAGPQHWLLGTYHWLEDESDAVLVGAMGMKDVAITKFLGVTHDIPSHRECQQCHNKGGEPILGFDALQLSDLIDPSAPHLHQGIASTMRISNFMAQGLFNLTVPTNVRVVAPSPNARSAIGYLHGNCGHCHNPEGRGRFTGFFNLFRLNGYGSFHKLDAVTTGLGVLTTGYEVPGRTIGLDSFRIEAGQPASSAVYIRMSQREGSFEQMPPIGTKAVDAGALLIIEGWISELK